MCGVPAILTLLAAVPAYLGWFPTADPELWQLLVLSAAFGLVLAAGAYLASLALGWIIAAFAGDGENSK